MLKLQKIVIVFLLVMALSPISSYAASDWEFRFFGINYKDFKGRKPLPIILGCVVSLAVHEAGHLLAGKLVGMDPSLKFGPEPVVWADDYYDKSDDQKALFHGGGFLAQTIVGSILTAIPKSRHTDFSVGFTGFSCVNNIVYSFDKGKTVDGTETSDVINLDNVGYPGGEIAAASGTISGALLYINLDKVKN